MAAAARIHRSDQLHARGKGDMSVRPGNADAARFKRLAERIENGTLKFWKFIEKQDAEMGKTDFAGSDLVAATHERRHRR